LLVPASTDVASGTYHACSLSQGQVFCWGDNSTGALGAIRTCPARSSDCFLNASVLPNLPAIKAIVAGDDVTCATAMDGRVYCFGDPTSAAIGNSDVPATAPPRPIQLPFGTDLIASRVRMFHDKVCAIDTQNTVWCWGNDFGTTPVREYMNATDIALGPYHTCVLQAGQVTCFGENRNGQAGDFEAAQTCEPEGGCPVNPTVVPLDHPVSVVVGERHSCALLASGDVACWGSNEFGQLGRTDAFLVGSVGIATQGAVEVVTSRTRTCARRSDGTAMCWGVYAEEAP
jgi:alpha-tubulin suppressor-like RCC1 family protein